MEIICINYKLSAVLKDFTRIYVRNSNYARKINSFFTGSLYYVKNSDYDRKISGFLLTVFWQFLQAVLLAVFL